MNEAVLDFEMEVIPRSSFTQDELARMDAITVAWFKARDAERALEAAQKHAIETAANLARLGAINEIECAQKPSKRRRAASPRKGVVTTKRKSPFDVPGVKVDITHDEIVAIVREGRER